MALSPPAGLPQPLGLLIAARMRLTGWAEGPAEGESSSDTVTRWGDGAKPHLEPDSVILSLPDLGAAHVAWDGWRGHGLLGSERPRVLVLSAGDGLTRVLSVLVFSTGMGSAVGAAVV